MQMIERSGNGRIVRAAEQPRHSGEPKQVRSHSHFENRMRYMAQSVLTGLIPYPYNKPELPTVAEAVEILAWTNGTHA